MKTEKKYTQPEEKSHEESKFFIQSIVGESVNGRVTENSTLGEERGINNEKKCGDAKKECREERLTFLFIKQHHVRCSYKNDPRNERSVLHWVPRPESTKAE